MNKSESTLIIKFLYALVASLIGIGVLYLAVKSDLSKGISIPLVLISWGGIAYACVKLNFWKELSVFMMIYTVFQGFTAKVPDLDILNETIRNLYFHVTMWFAMLFLLLASIIYSVLYLAKNDLKWDAFASGAAEAGTVMGVLGLLTGMIWAQYTWGTWWHWDPKQLYTAIGLLMYLAYFVLRGAFEDDIQKARISAVINIFAFPSLIVLLYILPRLMVSTHPGQEGNPAFSDYDLNADMRLVFYPAIIGWTLLAVWISSIKIRTRLLELRILER